MKCYKTSIKWKKSTAQFNKAKKKEDNKKFQTF